MSKALVLIGGKTVVAHLSLAPYAAAALASSPKGRLIRCTVDPETLGNLAHALSAPGLVQCGTDAGFELDGYRRPP
jgi:hypothetical protein